MPMFISFIIPALNEEANIVNTINSIKVFKEGNNKHSVEIILVDNGSTDNTVQVSKDLGCITNVVTNTTIAGLRNYGASIAKGDIFIFLDADVRLTREWMDNIDNVLESLCNNDILTGSHTVPPESDNWFLKYWFSSFAAESDSSHLGSAHMIITREIFEKLNGFNSELITAEDYDICQRAKSSNISIFNNKDLKVIHDDYPLTIVDFIKREMWHGVGDCTSFSHAIKSKSLIGSLVFFSLVVAFIFGLFINANLFALVSLFLLCAFLLLSSWVKYNHSGFKFVLVNAAIFILYYTGRLLSLGEYIKRSK